MLMVCSLLRLEPISAAASKEYSLEKNLEKMKLDWVNMMFSFVKYRDTVSQGTPWKQPWAASRSRHGSPSVATDLTE